MTDRSTIDAADKIKAGIAAGRDDLVPADVCVPFGRSGKGLGDAVRAQGVASAYREQVERDCAEGEYRSVVPGQRWRIDCAFVEGWTTLNHMSGPSTR